MSVLNLQCCGIKEFSGLTSDPKTNLLKMCYQSYDNTSKFAFLLFSQKSQQGTAGDDLAKFIEKHKLGTVYSIPSAFNPNTNNQISFWVWKWDHEAVRIWFLENMPFRLGNYVGNYDAGATLKVSGFVNTDYGVVAVDSNGLIIKFETLLTYHHEDVDN